MISQPLFAVALDPFLDGGQVEFSVDGDQSLGLGPFEFRWDSLSPTVLRPPQPNISFASRVRFTVSPDAGVGRYQFRLFVRDTLQRLSPEATGEVRAAYRPVAVLTPAQTTAGSMVTLSSAGSSDRGGLTLSHRFFIISGQAMVAINGTSATVSAPSPGVVVIGCEVENSFGLVSAQVFSTITFISPPGTIAVDAGPGQVVDGGTLLRLQGQALTAGPASFIWSERAPVQQPPLIINPVPGDPVRATIVAPFVRGGDQARGIRLEVRQPPGCTGAPPGCLVGAGDTTLVIQDREGPVPVVTLGGSSVGRFRSQLIEFDEPPASPAGFVPTLDRNNAGGGTTRLTITVKQESPTRFRVIPNLGFDLGLTYRLSAPPTRDATAQQNEGPPADVTFMVRPPIATITTSQSPVITGPTPPAPGVTWVPARPPLQSMVVVAGRRDGPDQAFTFPPMPAVSASLNQSPMFINAITGLPPHDGATHRAFTMGYRTVVQLAVASADGGMLNDGVVLTADFSGGSPNPPWLPLAQPMKPPASSPGGIATDGTTLFALVKTTSIVGLISAGPQGWPNYFTMPSALDMMQVNPSLTTDGQFLSALAFNGPQLSAAFFDPSVNNLFVGRLVAGVWTNAVIAQPNATKALRLVFLTNGNSLVATSPLVAGFPNLRISTFDNPVSGTVLLTSPVTGAISGFDMVSSQAGEHAFLAVAGPAGVTVWRRHGTPGSPWEQIDGPNAGAFGGTPGCAVANPELAATEDEGVFLVWAEACSGPNWFVSMARIE